MCVIDDMLLGKKRLHFTLIDPEKQSPVEAAEIAGLCESSGTDAVMIGSSTGTNKEGLMDETARYIKKAITVPLILFPNSADSITKYVDYIFFMSLLNSVDRRYFIGEQVAGARLVQRYEIKPISMGYVVVSTSMKETTVEGVASLDRIGVDEVEKAVSYALAAQYFGMDCVYLEAGSGAERPVSEEMVKRVKGVLDIPLIVGGGIMDGDTAKRVSDAGADVLVTGTVAEQDINAVKEIIGGMCIGHLVPRWR